MCNLTFLSENFVTTANLSVLVGDTDANFPVDNIKDVRTTKVFRSDSNTVEIQIDLLVTQAIDAFAIAGNSVDGLGFTSLTIYGSGSTDFSSSTPIVVDINAENNFGFKFFTEASFRFWKLEFTGTGSYTEVSNLFLGKRQRLGQNSFSIGSFTYLNADSSRVRFNTYSQPFVDKRSRFKNISGEIEYMNEAEYEILNEIILRHGITEPLWVITDPEGGTGVDTEFVFSVYGLLTAVPDISFSGFGIYNASLSLRQVG